MLYRIIAGIRGGRPVFPEELDGLSMPIRVTCDRLLAITQHWLRAAQKALDLMGSRNFPARKRGTASPTNYGRHLFERAGSGTEARFTIYSAAWEARQPIDSAS